MAANDHDEFNPDPLYEEFPRGARIGYGPDEGFNTFVRLNDERLFTAEALKNPAIRAFVDAPITVTYVQLKSSTREAEWYVHKPTRVLAGEIDGFEFVGFDDERRVADLREGGPIGTFVMNHERTLARHPIRTLMVTDGEKAGQIIHKGDGS